MAKEKITLIVVGDIIINRDDPKSIFDRVVDVLNSGDITFANCDQGYGDPALGGPFQFRPGRPDPRNIPALTYAGLDVVSMANNHTLDWGEDAMLDGLDRVRKVGIEIVGAGKNIAEARKPAILERKGNKVGFLAYGCIGPDHYEAEENKPGFAPMRAWTVYEPDPWAQPGNLPKVMSVAHKGDLAAMIEDVRKLKARVDAVVVSFHWGLHFVPAVIPMYEFEVGHAAIDAGADLIVGGHAHILKGIEVYKGKVIFHAMNNFAVGGPPSRVYDKWRPRGFDPLLPSKTYGFTPDPEIGGHPEARMTIIGKVAIEDGKIKKVSYLPCYINSDCQPEIMRRRDARGKQTGEYVEKISRSQNLPVTFSWDGDEVDISA